MQLLFYHSLDIGHLSILIKHESCRWVCLSVRSRFPEPPKAQGVIWANLKHDEARFC